LALSLLAGVLPAEPAVADDAPALEPRQLHLRYEPRTGDFDVMFESRVIRVLVPYSRTLFFVDKGRERGTAAELVRDLERYLNQKYRAELGRRPLTLVLIPTPRDQLLPRLRDGRGDIAAGNLSVTPARLEQVDFVAPEDLRRLRELVVTGPASPELGTLEDLSGKTLHIRPASSYHESALELNELLIRAGKAPTEIVRLPDQIEDEDELEMLNVGLLEIVVVDDWKARMWAQVLPDIRVRDDLVLGERKSGWAIRKNSPKLATELDDFYRNFARKQGVIAYRESTYHRTVKQITNSTRSADWKRFERAFALFEKYGKKYKFDPLMLAAQGYQESRLRQDVKSPVGAIGVMQIMPSTGRELGVGDIGAMEANIHAGTKYMDQLMTRYFKDADFSDENRVLFALASYNAGPGNVRKMRNVAAERGFDPNRWFESVEAVTAERIGLEPTTYVRNIYKYYTAYKLTLEAQEAQRRALEAYRRDNR
jgi:membrane-bound lytic murein transglycosylase MltF